MRTCLFAFFILCTMARLSAQEFEVPTYYSFEKAEDYEAYTPMVLEGINWWLGTPIAKEKTKRMECTAFLFKWVEGSPSVMVAMDTDIVTFANGNSDGGLLLFAFIAGWVQDALQNEMVLTKKVKNPKVEAYVKGNMAGLGAAIAFYENNRAHFPPIPEIENYSRMDPKAMEKFVRKKVVQSEKKGSKK